MEKNNSRTELSVLFYCLLYPIVCIIYGSKSGRTEGNEVRPILMVYIKRMYMVMCGEVMRGFVQMCESNQCFPRPRERMGKY